jgi:heptose-I-phosphate ethanolaminephosphotransferase
MLYSISRLANIKMKQSYSNKPLYFAFLAIFFALAFPLIIEVTFSDFVREGEYNSRLGWTLILMFIGLMSNKAWLIKLLLIPFIIGGSIDIGYAISFGGVFTTATLEAVFNTDTNEALEYAASYASLPLATILGFYWLILFGILKRIHFDFNRTKARTTFLALGLLLTVTAGYRITVMQRYHDTIPGVLGSMPSYYKGNIGLQQEIALRQQLVNTLKNDTQLEYKEEPQTYIFLIGESINRNHMSVYGYHRQTTPFLNTLNDNTIVFNNVISSHAQTNASLRVALTSAAAEQGNNYRKSPSIIDTANMAGFKTWWISNQQPLRATLASIADQADVTKFISNDYQGVEVNRYDEFMLPYIEDALADEAKHKIILVHMMGSHAQYANRYPEAFDQFNDTDVRAYEDDLSRGKINSINQYDNSVLYTDHVVQKTLEILKQDNATIKALTLFSDHGEEVYDKISIKGHSPDNVTANMIEVPFITWVSKGFSELKPQALLAMNNNQHQGFRLDDLYHFATNLIGISSQQVQQEKSLASSHFIAAKERKVYKKSYENALRYREAEIKSAPEAVGDNE